MRNVITTWQQHAICNAYPKVVEYVMKVSAISVEEVVTILHGQRRLL